MKNSLAHLPSLTQMLITSNEIKGCSFASLEYTTKGTNETQKALVNLGVSYEVAKSKDIEFLTNLKQADNDNFKGIESTLFETARIALLESAINPNEAQSQAQKNAYTHINGCVKYHNENGTIYIFAMSVSKKVISEGVYKVVKSAPLTIAKNIIRKEMKSTKYRNFIIEPNLHKAKISGETIEFEQIQ